MGSEFIKNNIPDASDNVLVYPLTTGALPVAIAATDSSVNDLVYVVPLAQGGGWVVQQPQPKFTIEEPEVPPDTTVVEFDIRIDAYPSSSYWGYELFSRAESSTKIVWMFGFSGSGSDTYPYRLKVMAIQSGVLKYVCDASKQLYIGTTYHIKWTAAGGVSGMTRNGLPQGVPYPCVLEYGLSTQINYPDDVVGTGLSHGDHQAFTAAKGEVSNIVITNS
jgi:hypothetical protein